MYKRFTVQQLKTIQNQFIPNLKKVLKNERCFLLTDLFKKIFAISDSVVYREGPEPQMRFERQGDMRLLSDEKERIEMYLDKDGLSGINSILKSNKPVKNANQSMLQIVMEQFNNGTYDLIDGKPYVVYDIETMMAPADNNLRGLPFELGYMIESQEKKYKYIGPENLKKFVDKMIEYDGWIIGYNNIRFDNPVIVYSAGYDDDVLKILNEKTLDLFVFLQEMTGRRLGLNKVATGLVGLAKVLEGGGLEGVRLLTEYKRNGDVELLNKVKKYCRGDVQMTLGVLIYFLKFQQFFWEGSELSFDHDQFVQLGRFKEKKQDTKKAVVQTSDHLFGA